MSYNEQILKIAFLPTENKSYTDTLTMKSDVFADDITLDITGDASISDYDVKDNIGLTWDMISFLFFGVYDKILEIWQANKHITDTQKKAATPPVGTPLFIPVLDDSEKAAIKNQSTNIVPPWKR